MLLGLNSFYGIDVFANSTKSSLTFGMCRKNTSPPELIEGRASLSTLQTDDGYSSYMSFEGDDNDDADAADVRSLD
ncbi:MAG: hypothetical protein ACI8RD_000068 [Bacillariaceae sp.]|jgi:hypothetical protein